MVFFLNYFSPLKLLYNLNNIDAKNRLDFPKDVLFIATFRTLLFSGRVLNYTPRILIFVQYRIVMCHSREVSLRRI